MAGLLGDITDDPRTMGLLSLGLGMMNSRGNIGQALGQAGPQALDAMRQVKQDQQRRAQFEQQQAQQAQQMAMAQQAQAMQQEQHAQSMRQAQQQMADQQRQRDYLQGLQSPQMQASGAALSGGGGPTVGNAARMPAVDPMQQMMFGAVKAGAMPLSSYISSLQKDDTPMTLSEGGQLVTRGGRVLASNPKSPDQPSAVKEYNFAVGQGYAGSFDEWNKSTKRAGATNVRVDAGQRFENAYSTEQGKSFSETMAGINKTAFAAPSQIRKLERMEVLLDGVDGGKLAPTGLDVASMANSIGIKMDPKLGNKEAAQALAREIAGGFRQPGTGPMTDKDFENFLLQVPDLSKSAEGRKQIMKTMKTAASRDIQIAKMAREYERKNGKLDNGFLDDASQYIAENPVVGMPSGWRVR